MKRTPNASSAGMTRRPRAKSTTSKPSTSCATKNAGLSPSRSKSGCAIANPHSPNICAASARMLGDSAARVVSVTALEWMQRQTVLVDDEHLDLVLTVDQERRVQH